MENATKALLIAGAVLIAIVLISIGVSLLNKSKGTTDQAEAVATSLSGKAESSKNSINTTLDSL